MKIITIAAEKGSVGKSTLTATLSVIAALEGRGARVGLLDADPQGSLTAWWNARSAEWPLIFGLVGTIGQTVAAIEGEGLTSCSLIRLRGILRSGRRPSKLHEPKEAPCSGHYLRAVSKQT